MSPYRQVGWLLLKRELLQRFRCRQELFNPLLFFLLVAALFPLAIGVDPQQLPIIGIGAIWVAVLLATLLALPQLFNHDCADGSLEQMILSSYPLSYLVLIKTLAHGLMLILPLLVMSPLLALMFHFSADAIAIMLLSLLLGAPILMLLGSIGAALTVGLRNGALLMTLLLLPLYVPTLIFASSAINAANQRLSAAGALAWLGVLLILALVFSPFISAFALRLGVVYD